MKLRQERPPPLTFLSGIFFFRDIAPFFFHGKGFSIIHYGSSKLKQTKPKVKLCGLQLINIDCTIIDLT
jgi:hypothetical protein